MNATLLVLGLVGIVISVWADQSAAAAGIGIIALGYSIAAGVDISRLTRDVAPSLRNRGHTPLTGLGRWLHAYRTAVEYRIDALEWQISAPAPRLSTREIVKTLPALNAVGKSGDGSATRDEILPSVIRRVFDACMQGFRARAVALILPVNGHGDLIRDVAEIVGWRVWSHGISGTRWEAQVRHVLTPWLEHGRLDTLGTSEGSAEHSLFSEFSSYGFQHTIAVPISWEGDGAATLRGALWLGYEPHRSPLAIEEERARELSMQIGREFAAITTLKDLSGKLEEAQKVNRQKSDFIAQMSHDIRSPLNNIKAILTLFGLGDRSGEEREMMEAALGNCNSLSEIVEDILDFSRHNAGRLIAHPELFECGPVIRDVVESFSPSARLRSLTLQYRASTDPLFIRADRRQMRRVMTNIVSNALKYTSQGSITVTLAAIHGRVRIEVKDTGCGMSSTQIAQLFTPFMRFHENDPSMASVDGIGLGLAVSRILLELNHGVIGVSSQVGQGSVFSLELPRAEAPAEIMVHPTMKEKVFAAAVAVPPPALGPRIKVLVVDDDVDCVTTTSRALTRAGFEVMSAYSVNDAINMINFESPDMIITDDQMPDGGGRRLLGYLKRSARSSACIVMSGNDDRESQTDLKDLGAAEVFLKPVELDALIMWIRVWHSEEQPQSQVA